MKGFLRMPVRHAARWYQHACSFRAGVQASGGTLQGIPPEGCVPLRPSYVADLRAHPLKGNTTLAPADNNTTRKVSSAIAPHPYSYGAGEALSMKDALSFRTRQEGTIPYALCFQLS
jgi:hypothetical protein